MNYLVSPILYNGAGINDIIAGIEKSAKAQQVSFNVLHLKRRKLTVFGLDNPEEYAFNCLSTISNLLKKLKDGDKVLFIDFFFPGLDILEYFLRMNKISVFKVGLLHGSPNIKGDFFENETWLKVFEKAWFEIFNVVISPSNYFLNYLPEKSKRKIIVSKWPLNSDIKPRFGNKKIDVIFPHRFAHDKGVKDFYEIVKRMKDVNFVVTGFSKEILSTLPKDLHLLYSKFVKLGNVSFLPMESQHRHLLTLSSSKIVLSTARQEGFGYAVFKSVQTGNIPVLPFRCCYPEFFETKYMYKTIEEAVGLIYSNLKSYPAEFPTVNIKEYNFDDVIKLFK